MRVYQMIIFIQFWLRCIDSSLTTSSRRTLSKLLTTNYYVCEFINPDYIQKT